MNTGECVMWGCMCAFTHICPCSYGECVSMQKPAKRNTYLCISMSVHTCGCGAAPKARLGLQLTWDPGANLVAITASSLQRPPGASLGTWRTEEESTWDEIYPGIQPSCSVESKFKNCIDKLPQRSLYSMCAFPKFLILASSNP